jgi:hypothetical protein
MSVLQGNKLPFSDVDSGTLWRKPRSRAKRSSLCRTPTGDSWTDESVIKFIVWPDEKRIHRFKLVRGRDNFVDEAGRRRGRRAAMADKRLAGNTLRAPLPPTFFLRSSP